MEIRNKNINFVELKKGTENVKNDIQILGKNKFIECVSQQIINRTRLNLYKQPYYRANIQHRHKQDWNIHNQMYDIKQYKHKKIIVEP